nr:Maf family nucleotide pyrophosphatase [Chiayiivirga flava]
MVLASTSLYRRALLERFGLRFEAVAPDVDETALPDERPAALASRLAREKARAVARRRPDAVVIGSDQVADLDGRALGKPGGFEAARRQLHDCAGRSVLFHTAVCVVDGARGTEQAFVDVTRVVFRVLRDDEIVRYLHAEQPYDCAGSFKCEGLGAALFERIETVDPTALIGLPLIALADALRGCGYALP